MSKWRAEAILWGIFAIPVAWLAMIIAQCYEHGESLPDFLTKLDASSKAPLRIHVTHNTGMFLLIFLGIYGVCWLVHYLNKRTMREGEEQGSAKWGNVKLNNASIHQEPDEDNIILTRNLSIGLNAGQKTGKKLNRNVLVIGSSGRGKSRFYVKPNLLQANTSFVVTDPKGELLAASGEYLKRRGYEIRVLNLVDMEHSNGYNPLAYIRHDKQVTTLIENLIKNTEPKNAQKGDPFWENSTKALLSAFIFYMLSELHVHDRTFASIIRMLEKSEAREDNEDYMSSVDILFDTLKNKNPHHMAVKQYAIFKQAAGKTAKSILVSTSVLLQRFSIYEIENITHFDEMELDQVGTRKMAIFAVTPNTDISYNFLVGMFYTQLFQEMHRVAEANGGSLPFPVHCIFDEFANIAQPDGFEREINQCRSLNVGMSVIIQNLGQLKNLYRYDAWTEVVGGCTTMLFLGSDDLETCKFISESLGKQTIRVMSSGVSRGRGGSSSQNFQQVGRDLKTPDEVRRLESGWAYVMMSFHLPIHDRKYDLLAHPYANFTPDGNETMPVYRHNVEHAASAEDDKLLMDYDAF